MKTCFFLPNVTTPSCFFSKFHKKEKSFQPSVQLGGVIYCSTYDDFRKRAPCCMPIRYNFMATFTATFVARATKFSVFLNYICFKNKYFLEIYRYPSFTSKNNRQKKMWDSVWFNIFCRPPKWAKLVLPMVKAK